MGLSLYSNKIENRISRVIAVAAGKGGVGKSTVAVMLACALKKSGKKVGLMDADLYGPSIRKMVPSEKNAVTENGRHYPANNHGLLTLSFADFKNSLQANSMRAPLVDQWIREFVKNTNWGELDYLIIDCPPGTGDILLSLSQHFKIDYGLIVTTPQEVALIDVRRTIKFFSQVGIPLLGIVENMSYFSKEKIALFGSGGGASLSREFNLPLLAELPFIPKLGALSDRGFNIYDSKDPDYDELKKEMEGALSKMNMSKGEEPTFAPEGPHAFSITFAEGEKRVYHLGELQKHCPCANCQEKTPLLDSEMTAKGVMTVGRYAIKVDFDRGCSNGIYPFALLKTLGRPS